MERDAKLVRRVGVRHAVLEIPVVALLRRSLVELRWPLVTIFLVFAVVFGSLIVIRASTGIAIAEFTRDPLGFTGLPVYKGSVSNLGVLVWMSGAAICFFAYGMMRSRRLPGRASTFLLAGGLITLMLVLDDLYMLHEVVFPDHVGIPQTVVYGAYVASIAWLLVWYRSTIRQTRYLLLALALAGFTVSILSDAVAQQVTIPAFYIVEDGGKFVGILSWTSYFILESIRQMNSDHETRMTRSLMRVD